MNSSTASRTWSPIVISGLEMVFWPMIFVFLMLMVKP